MRTTGIESMATFANPSCDFGLYVCPACKSQLESQAEALECRGCHTTYPIVGGIPDFIAEDLDRSPTPLLRWANRYYDLWARAYEWSRFPLRPILYAGLGAPSLDHQVRELVGLLGMNNGLVLDVACGPGTLERRIASACGEVYGIDISAKMLRQGQAYARNDHLDNTHFARARVEGLPFPDGRFDAAVCGAALQAFSDPISALREVARTLKAGAPLVVITVAAGDRGGIFRFRYFRDSLQRRGLHVFKVSDLQRYVAEAGLEDFRAQEYGSLILFRVRKRGP